MQESEELNIYTSDDERTEILIAYIVMFLGIFTFVPWVAGGLWAIIRDKTNLSEHAKEHYRNLRRVFIYGSLFYAITFALMLVFIGWVILPFVMLWVIYRLVKGLTRLNDGSGYYTV